LPSQFIIAKRKQALAYNDNYFKLRFTPVVTNDEIQHSWCFAKKSLLTDLSKKLNLITTASRVKVCKTRWRNPWAF